MRFYQNGKVRSLILWPNEKIVINTPAGKMPVRIGFKLFEDGSIDSVEPAHPVTVKIPAGSINSYDADAVGIEADRSSLRFDRAGRLISLTTFDIITVRKNNGEKEIIYPKLRPGLIEDFETVPIKLTFDADTVIIYDGTKKADYRLSECKFLIMRAIIPKRKSVVIVPAARVVYNMALNKRL